MRRYICLSSTKTERQRDNHEDNGQFERCGGQARGRGKTVVFSEFLIFFSRRSAPCGSCLLNYLLARTHPTSSQRDHDRRMGGFGRCEGTARGGWGSVQVAFRRKSPTCGLFSATTSSSAQMVVDDAKDQRRDRYALLAETSTESSLAIAPPVLVRLSVDGKMQARVGVPASTMQPPAGRLGA